VGMSAGAGKRWRDDGVSNGVGGGGRGEDNGLRRAKADSHRAAHDEKGREAMEESMERGGRS
jgi:hypothetical protein